MIWYTMTVTELNSWVTRKTEFIHVTVQRSALLFSVFIIRLILLSNSSLETLEILWIIKTVKSPLLSNIEGESVRSVGYQSLLTRHEAECAGDRQPGVAHCPGRDTGGAPRTGGACGRRKLWPGWDENLSSQDPFCEKKSLVFLTQQEISSTFSYY